MNPEKLTDEQLVLAVLNKNQELYSEIIKRYQLKLSHYLRKFIYNPDELEDVLQVVFIKAYKNLYSFNVKKKFSSWIYRISHNEALNHLKKYAKERIPLEDIEYKLIDEKIDLNKEIDRKLLKTEVEELLSILKLKYREPLILYFFEQKSYQEISDILHMPISTVGTLISRAKKTLKDNLVNQKKILK